MTVEQLDVARVLLLAGADCHARDKRSRCPLHMAASSGNEELVKLLIAAGAHVKKASVNGTTPLHNAVSLLHTTLYYTVLSYTVLHRTNPFLVILRFRLSCDVM